MSYYGPNLFFNISMGNFVLFCYLLQLGCSIFLISFIVPEFFTNLKCVIQMDWSFWYESFFPILPFDAVSFNVPYPLIWLYPYFTCCFIIILLSSSPWCVLNLHLAEAIPTTIIRRIFDQVRAAWKGSRSWTKRITLWLLHFPAHADESTGSEWVG